MVAKWHWIGNILVERVSSTSFVNVVHINVGGVGPEARIGQ